MSIVNFLPQNITAFNVFVDGHQIGTKVKSLDLPKIAFKTNSYQAAASGGEVEFLNGLEAMSFSCTIGDLDPYVLSKVGLQSLKKTTVTCRAATRNKDGIKVPYAVRMQGNISMFDPGTWDLSKLNEVTFEMKVDYFRVKIAEVKIIEIDVLKMIQYIGGVDQLEMDRIAILRGMTVTV